MSSMTQQSPSYSSSNEMDCSLLLSHVLQHEASLPPPSRASFGHEIPRLELCQTAVLGDENNSEPRNHTHVLIAYTQRCVSAQIMEIGEGARGQQADGPFQPISVLALPSIVEDSLYLESAVHDEEVITCLSAFSWLDHDSKNTDGTADTAATSTVRDPSILALASCVGKFVVAVGTNLSRVLCMEINVLELHSGNHQTGDKPVFLRLENTMPYEPLPRDNNIPSNNDDIVEDDSTFSIRSSNHYEPFQPMGGVCQISSFRVPHETENRDVTMTWISYRDGTLVRIDATSLFISTTFAKAVTTSAQNSDNQTAQAVHQGPKIQRFRLLLPSPFSLLWTATNRPDEGNQNNLIVLPLPKYHASTILPAFSWNDSAMSCNWDDNITTQPRVHDPIVEAMVFSATTSNGLGGTPSIVFYTSEDYTAAAASIDGAEGKIDANKNLNNSDVLDVVLGGTKAIVTGVMGSALGAVKWGLGSSDKRNTDKLAAKSRERRNDGPRSSNLTKNTSPFPAVPVSPTFLAMHNNPTVYLVAGFEMHDAPRQITFATIDPDGNLAATADNLGRVLLIDLASKQVIRMWKGFREATCYWLQVPRPESSKSILYLVIHSRPRHVVEIWRTRHGPRVLTLQVSRNAQILPCREVIQSSNGSDRLVLLKCYISDSLSAGATSSSRVEELMFSDVGLEAKSSHRPSIQKQGETTEVTPLSQHEAALRLQLLQQLLADTNVPCQSQDVYEALTKITSLKDLVLALDLTATSQALEKRMGIDGAAFQTIAIKHCQDKLDRALEVSKGGASALDNPNVLILKLKIDYYKQVVDAFDVLHKFETDVHGDDEDQHVAPRSVWAVEAVGWTSTYEKVTGLNIDADIEPVRTEPLLFATFAKACVPPSEKNAPNTGVGRHATYLSDSSRTRRDVLVHIFKPLLGDIFAFNVVNSIFECLGIADDYSYLLKCFGEWFQVLSSKVAAQKGLFGLYSPLLRWLQEIAVKQIDLGGSYGPSPIILKALHVFCGDSPDLVRAFMLATLCREAVANATRRKEETTYGKVSSTDAVKPWDELLRKIRVCLLVSLRLFKEQLGTFPITVHNVDQPDLFSVYEWLARDELSMTHNHSEIISLEHACRISGYAFHPSTSVGDDPIRVKMLQNACLSAAISEAERAEYLVDFDDDDRLGALLLFLSHHNNPSLLVAHRALLLALKWTTAPIHMDLLNDSLEALRSLSEADNYKALATAVRLEVWQARIRPFCRALLFGFDDVHDISENVAATLFHNAEWVRTFARVGLEVLMLLSRIRWDEDDQSVMTTFRHTSADLSDDDTLWPTVKDDFILQRITSKSKLIDPGALDTHCVILSAVLVSDNISALSKLIPGFFEAFTHSALFSPPIPVISPTTQKPESPPSLLEKRHAFLEDCLIARAQSYRADEQQGLQPLESLDLGEIDTLAKIWEIDPKDSRTLFLLAMYEFGKDRLVDELLSKCASQISISHFVEDGLDICCRRIHDFLRKNLLAPQQRHIIAMLDADICEWVRERAEKSQPLAVLERLSLPLSHTHLFILRLLNLCAAAPGSTTRVRIHALSVLSGTLLRALPSER